MHKRNTNETKTKNYNLGLNLGTASIGWALTDNHDKVLNHVRGKRAIGTRMFKEGSRLLIDVIFVVPVVA